MRGDIRCVRALLHEAALGWRKPRRYPSDRCAQGIRSPLYRRNRQKARRGDHPHPPRRGRRHRRTQPHHGARCDVFAPGLQPPAHRQRNRHGAGLKRIVTGAHKTGLLARFDTGDEHGRAHLDDIANGGDDGFATGDVRVGLVFDEDALPRHRTHGLHAA